MSMPNSRRNLDIAIERLAKDSEEAVRIRRTMANAIVGQLLPDGAVKGGSSLKLRFGDGATRFSRDLDTARASDIDSYVERLEDALASGWNGFTGKLVPGKPAKPKGVPTQYIMQPFEVKLSYNGKSWITVPFEVGHNEIGDADDPDMLVPEDVSRMFVALGFPPLDPMPFMKLAHQVAQKLHALTEEGSDRVHDLVDLQIIMREDAPDVAAIKPICIRLFAYRRMQEWPPRIVAYPDWEIGYAAAAEGLDVLDLDQAIVWGNDLISRIDKCLVQPHDKYLGEEII